MRQAVAGKAHLHPGHPELGQLLQLGEVGVGIEIVVGGAATIEVGEDNVDLRGVPSRVVDPAAQVVDAGAETIQ